MRYRIVKISSGRAWISRSYLSCITAALYPLTNIFSYSHHLALGNHHSTLCFYEFDHFRFHMQVRSYSILSFSEWLISVFSNCPCLDLETWSGMWRLSERIIVSFGKTHCTEMIQKFYNIIGSRMGDYLPVGSWYFFRCMSYSSHNIKEGGALGSF